MGTPLEVVDRLAVRLDRARSEGRLPRPDVLLGWLVAAHVLLKLLILPLVLQAPPYNDEQAYFDGGRALSNLLRDVFAFTSPDTQELERNVVASGWFMPGMPVVLAPLFVVVPDAPDWLIRLYLGGASLLVLLAAVRAVRRRLGPWWAALLVAFPGLVPGWVVLSYTGYGDALAGLLLAVLVAHVIAMLRDFRAGVSAGAAEGLQLGLLAVGVLYLRSSASTAVAAMGLVVLGTALVLVRGRQRWRAAGVLALAGLVFVALLAPWSWFASRTLDDRVITTTSVQVSLANTFGEDPGFGKMEEGPPDELCFGPCDPDSTPWFAPLRYARELGRATGVSEIDAQEAMADYALEDLTPTAYARQVLQNAGSYALIPGNFVFYIVPDGGHGPAGFIGQILVAGVTYIVYLPVLLLMMCAMVTVQRRSLEAQVLDVVVKLAIGALFVQPFVHVSGSRYWTTAGPLFAFAAIGFLLERAARQSGVALEGPARSSSPYDSRLARWTLRTQYALAGATSLVAATVLVLAI